MKSRAWLRSFLHLDARMDLDQVPATDIRRQEDTVLHALDLLDREPGVVLADEVGMGKTFEALGVIAAFRHQNPRSRAVIITPGPDLNGKWKGEFDRFRDRKATLYDFGEKDVLAASTLEEFIGGAREHPLLLVPITVFNSVRGGADQAYLISLYLWWRNREGRPLHGHTVNAMLDRFRGGRLWRVDVERERFLGRFELADLERHLDDAFNQGGRGDRHEGLEDLFESSGERYLAFENADRVRRALDLARFRLVRALLPDFELLVVDEAHKLKNPETLRWQAIATVFRRKYDRALFMTATPFQLSIEELGQVFETFSNAKGARDLRPEADALLQDVRAYQDAYERLFQAWATLDSAAGVEFSSLYERDPELSRPIPEPAFRAVAERVREVRHLKKERIEPGFRRWMIRSLREEKRAYRQHLPSKLQARGEAALPFLVYERFIAELFRRGQGTHKASVEINMVSSYAAARQGNLIAGEEREFPPSAEAYRQVLRGILRSLDAPGAAHPKVDFVLNDALEAAERGEKTLIFCARVATLPLLAKELSKLWEEKLLDRWRKALPGARPEDIFDETREEERSRGWHSRLQARLHGSRDRLYLALRERLSEPLARLGLDPVGTDPRIEVVESLSSYLTRRDVPFLADLVIAARARGWELEQLSSPRLLELVDGFWETDEGRSWLERLRAFLEYFATRNTEQQKFLLKDAVLTGHFVRQTKERENRERLREAFNTPLFPMVLVANEVMQEGLDLHKSCRRIIHHDLAWNPAQLEQRVGRIDRLGSLTARLREQRPEVTLDVLYPLIRSTIDERLFRIVKEREKWLEFLLGAPPDFQEYADPESSLAPLPPALAQALAINLRPPVAPEG